MAYVNFEYYETEYIPSGNAIPHDQFTRYEKRAREELDRITFNRLQTDDTLIGAAVKDCMCAIAEALYIADQIPANADAPLSSYSNDGESGTYDLKESMRTREGKAKKIREIAHRYLFMTGLLYAGVGGYR